MSDQPLKHALKAHYQSVELNEAQLNQLDRLQAQYKVDEAKPQPHKTPPYAIAATLLLALTAGVIFGTQFSSTQVLPDTSVAAQEAQHQFQRIAEEVTLNHRKLRPLEVTSSAFNEVRDYFTQLDFRPSRSELFNPQNSTLIGGRYCSIEGVMAAQIRYQNENGEMTTLYETAYEPSVFKNIPDVDAGLAPIIQYSDGYKVALWKEKGLIMASVSAPD